MWTNKKCLCLFFVVSLLLFIKPSWAENPTSQDEPWEKFSLSTGYFISNIDSNLSLGSGLGLTVNLEDLLGFDSTDSVFRVDALWRFTENRRHRLDLTWFSFRRDGSITIGRGITIKDDEDNEINIPAGSRVESNFDLDIYRGRYSYSFFQDDRMDLAFSIGAYIMPIDVGIRSSGRFVNVDESETFIAPLPTLGLRADFAITPKWYLKSNFDIFYLEINEFTGTLYETNIAIEYIPWKHFGFGLAGNIFNLKIEADGEDYPGIDFKGEIEFRYAGLLLYAKVPF